MRRLRQWAPVAIAALLLGACLAGIYFTVPVNSGPAQPVIYPVIFMILASISADLAASAAMTLL